MGSPKGAIFFTVICVPGVRPMSTSRRFTAPRWLPTDWMTPDWPGAKSCKVWDFCPCCVVMCIPASR